METNAIAPVDDFDRLMMVMTDSLRPASVSSYVSTYRQWVDYCHNQGWHALDVTRDNVNQFVNSGDLAHTTRMNRLSHMRKLAQLMAVGGDRQREGNYRAIRNFIVVRPSDKPERTKRALNPAEANLLLQQWQGDCILHIRNKAMIRLLLFTGVRRSELVALRWDDIDLERGIIQVRHGKGDKRRDVAIMDVSDSTEVGLGDLHNAMGRDREYAFCGLTRGKNQRFGPDSPTCTLTVERVVKATATRAGIGRLAPHDLRRTHITEYLATGGALHDAQAQAGHKDGATTMSYAQPGEAEQRGRDSRFRFMGG